MSFRSYCDRIRLYQTGAGCPSPAPEGPRPAGRAHAHAQPRRPVTAWRSRGGRAREVGTRPLPPASKREPTPPRRRTQTRQAPGSSGAVRAGGPCGSMVDPDDLLPTLTRAQGPGSSRLSGHRREASLASGGAETSVPWGRRWWRVPSCARLGPAQRRRPPRHVAPAAPKTRHVHKRPCPAGPHPHGDVHALAARTPRGLGLRGYPHGPMVLVLCRRDRHFISVIRQPEGYNTPIKLLGPSIAYTSRTPLDIYY